MLASRLQQFVRPSCACAGGGPPHAAPPALPARGPRPPASAPATDPPLPSRPQAARKAQLGSARAAGRRCMSQWPPTRAGTLVGGFGPGGARHALQELIFPRWSRQVARAGCRPPRGPGQRARRQLRSIRRSAASGTWNRFQHRHPYLDRLLGTGHSGASVGSAGIGCRAGPATAPRQASAV